MNRKPFFVRRPWQSNARRELMKRSRDWEDAYPITFIGPLIIPSGLIFPRWMLPSTERINRWNRRLGWKGAPPLAADDISTLAIDLTINKGCALLTKLPPELRLDIWSLVLGNDRVRIVSVPWTVKAVPDKEGNVSMTQADFSSERNHRSRSPRLGVSLLLTCRQVYQEAIDCLHTTNTFIFYDLPTLNWFSTEIVASRLSTSIRHVEIYYSPNISIPYQHGLAEQYDLPSTLDEYWDIIMDMKALRSLKINLEAYARIWEDVEPESREKSRLSPLLKLRGLRSFDLKLGYIGFDDEVRYDIYAPSLRREIFEAVTRPRVE